MEDTSRCSAKKLGRRRNDAKQEVSAVCFSLVMLVVLSMVGNPVVFASVQPYEKELKIVSGSNRDLRAFTYCV
jgi:hypothetical protein